MKWWSELFFFLSHKNRNAEWFADWIQGRINFDQYGNLAIEKPMCTKIWAICVFHFQSTDTDKVWLGFLGGFRVKYTTCSLVIMHSVLLSFFFSNVSIFHSFFFRDTKVLTGMWWPLNLIQLFNYTAHRIASGLIN